MSEMVAPPILVEAFRGKTMESRHRGFVAVVKPDGCLHASLGDPSGVTFMRSAAKPIQALPVITSGAAERFRFTAAEIAVMTSSHSGEPMHTQKVNSVLKKIGLETANLRCGTHAPADWSSSHITGGQMADALQNNCSGKHAGMLAQCVAGGYDVETYTCHEHAIQQRIRRTIITLGNVNPETVILGVENCGAPVFGIPIDRLALAYARLANPADLEPKLGEACRIVSTAMIDYPEMVAGEERLCTDIMRAGGRTIIAKAGAEAVYAMGVLPCRRYPDGLGIAFKIEGGSERATGPVAIEILCQIGLLDREGRTKLATWHRRINKGFQGVAVGELSATFRLKFNGPANLPL